MRLLFHVDAVTWYQLLLEHHITASKFSLFFAHLSGLQSALAGITEEHKPFICVLIQVVHGVLLSLGPLEVVTSLMKKWAIELLEMK